MISRFRWFHLAIIGLYLSLGLATAAAQEELSVPVVVDGVSHVIAYPPDTSLSKIQTVRRVLETALPRFTARFGGVSPRIAMVFTNTPPSDPATLAAAGPRRAGSTLPYDCWVYIYRSTGNNNSAIFRFTLAHEIVHCFQFQVNPASIASIASGADDNAWWVEGSAEWLAARIYPPIGNPIAETITGFYNISNQSPFINDYENYWFFNFFARRFGDAAVIDLIRAIPSTRAAQPGYLEGVQSTPDMMLAYGRLVQQRGLRHQPAYPPRNPADYVARTLPHEQTVRTPPLSISPVRMTLPTPAAGKGIRIALSGGVDDGYRALLADGTPVTADGVTLCGADLTTTLYLMVTRGYDNDEEADGRLTFTEAPCVSSVCFAGEWIGMARQRVGSAIDTLLLEPTAVGEVRFSVSPDGSVFGQVVGVQDIPNGFVLINSPAPVFGSFTVTGAPVEIYPGTLVVPISFASPITGSVTSDGGTVDANDIWTFTSGLTATLNFPAYRTVECGNPTTTPDGITVYNYLGFHEVRVEDLIAGYALPVLELGREGSF